MADTPDQPPIRPADLPQGKRIANNLKDVLRAAKPHWKPILISFLLMALQSAMNTGRIILFLPVFTHVLEFGDSEADQSAQRDIEKFREKGGVVFDGVISVVEGVNHITRPLVSPTWYESKLEGVEDAAAQARITEWQETKYATLMSIILLFAVVIMLMCAATYGETLISMKAQLSILMDVREAIVRKVLTQPISFFDQRRRGELVQRVLGDVAGYAKGLGLAFSLVRTIFNLGAPIITLFLLSPKLTLGLLIAIPFLAPIRKLSMRTLKRAHRRQQESTKLFQVLLQSFSGVRIVKSLGSEEARSAEFRDTDEGVTKRALKVQRAKSAASALITLLNNLLALVLVVGGGWAVMTGRIDIPVGTLFIFSMLAATLYQPIKRIVKQYNNLVDASASIERATEYLNLPGEYERNQQGSVFPGIRDAIRFESVGFHYAPESEVLTDISFEMPRGNTVALVGPSGSGKSTICDLVLGFYHPTAGRIMVDGAPLDDFSLGSYLDRVAIVSQSPFLFHTTIRENIRQGRPSATDAEIEAAAKAAYIHDDIMVLEHGYDEVVGEDGVRLSGGQKQRITIARALVRDPEILVLDEATASLDTASERAVQLALESLLAGRTTLVVAHRLSTIKNANRILVIDSGRIVDEGTHEELVARGGLYAELVRLQDVSTRE